MMIEKGMIQLGAKHLKSSRGWFGGAGGAMMIEKVMIRLKAGSPPHDDRQSDDSLRGEKSKQ